MAACVATVLIWQVFEYKKERNYYKFQERWHQSIYVDDKYDIKSKSINDISVLIEDARREVDRLSQTLPVDGYYNVYKILNKLKTICISNKVHLEILGIKTNLRIFYRGINFNCTMKGKRKDIIKSIQAIKSDSLIINLEDACFKSVDSEYNVRLDLHFSSFLFIPSKPSQIKSNRPSQDPLDYTEVKTWLPPLSIWIKRYHIKALSYKKHQNETPEFNNKVSMIKQLKKIRNQQRAMADLINDLSTVNAGSDQGLTNIGNCL